MEIKNGAGGLMDEYLTLAEVAARLKIKPKTIKNKMAAGIFQKGVHYFKPKGLGPRFKWSAVRDWIEGNKNQQQTGIPMKRGYVLNVPTSRLRHNSQNLDTV